MPVRCSRRRDPRRLALLAGTTTLVIMACVTTITSNAVVAPTEDRPECPHTPEFVIVDTVPDDEDEEGDETRVTQTTIQQVPLSGPITDIPEFHDCQRFIVQTSAGDRYDSLYAIYASDSLDDLDSALSLLMPDPGDTAAVAVATVYSYGGDYPSLGIESGFNCLYLSKAGTLWRAWMLPRGPNEPDCARRDDEINESGDVTRLHVIRDTMSGATFDDYPPVTRWHWDVGSNRQLIGVKCGRAWCIVSDQPTVTLAPLPTDIEFSGASGSNVAPRPVAAIRGWYDDQRLAHRGPHGDIVPSDVWGVTVPDPTLYSHRLDDYVGAWVRVASIRVQRDYDGAVLKLVGNRSHDIYLCSSDCPELPTGVNSPTCITPPGASRFWYKMTRRTGVFGKQAVYGCVVRRGTDHGPVPGTARWRWLANDETTWTRCSEGCCELK